MVELRYSCNGLKIYKGKFNVNTTVFNSVAVDPNVGCKSIYSDVKTLLITHGHADHFGDALLLDGVRVLAPRHETPLIENPEINWRGMFSWAKLPESIVTPYFLGKGVRVDDFSDGLSGDIVSVSMPGHTPSHTAYMINGCLIASDAIHCPCYWEKFRILYYVDPDKMAESLIKIKKMDWDCIIPGHGDVFEREEGLKVIDLNLRMLEKIDREIFEEIPEEGIKESEILSIFSDRYGFHGVKAILVIMPAIRGHITSMCGRGITELFEKDGFICVRRLDRYSRLYPLNL